MYVAEVRVELKPGVADPEGANTKKALELLGFKGVRNVKSVHAFSIELDAVSKGEAQSAVSEMCKRLLVNPVIHVPRITLTNGAAPRTARSASSKPRAATKKKAPKPSAKKAKPKKSGKKR